MKEKLKNNKKKILIILLILIVILAAAIIVIKYQKSFNNNTSSICNNIQKNIKNKDNYIIFVINESKSNNNANNVIKQYIKKNEKKDIYLITYEESKEECLSNILNKDALLPLMKDDKVPTVLIYENGNYKTSLKNVSTVKSLEDFIKTTYKK